MALLIDQFEGSGDGNVRLAILDQRIPAVKAGMDLGRASIRAGWPRSLRQLARRPGRAEAGLSRASRRHDVYTWKLLRRDFGLGRRATQRIMTDMVGAILDSKRKEP